MSSTNITSKFDHILAALLKSCIDSLIIHVTEIVIKSLKDVHFLQCSSKHMPYYFCKKTSLDKKIQNDIAKNIEKKRVTVLVLTYNLYGY